MTIDRLGPIDPVSNYNKTNKTTRPQKPENSDSINLSSEAKSLSEMYRIADEVKRSPDVRQEKVAEIKEKLKDPSYINDEIVEKVAENIMGLFKI